MNLKKMDTKHLVKMNISQLTKIVLNYRYYLIFQSFFLHFIYVYTCLSELTPVIFHMKLIHLDSEAFIFTFYSCIYQTKI